MALPANDPYEVAAPVITAEFCYTSGNVYWGVLYQLRWEGNRFCAFGEYIMARQDAADTRYPASLWNDKYAAGDMILFSNSGGGMGSQVEMHFTDINCSLSGHWHRIIKNPIWYVRQLACDIILGIAHWHCGIEETDIDVSAWTAERSWETGNYLYRSVAFVNDSALKLLKDMMDQTLSVFLYVNLNHQLSVSHLTLEPASADWVLDNGNIVRVLRVSEIRDRQVPGVVKIGWDKRAMPHRLPKEGVWKRTWADVVFTDEELIRQDEYHANSVDNGSDDMGDYIDMSDCIVVEAEVGGIGFCMDLNETVQVNLPEYGLSNDPSYPDWFRVHKIALDPNTMTATLTLLKYNLWNLT